MHLHRRQGVPFLGRRNQRTRSGRAGTAVVELAICLPLLALLTFASIEAANAIFLKQALTEAAYEAARTATTNGGTQSEATARADQLLAARGITASGIEFEPAITPAVQPGTPVTVSVSAPAASNAVGPVWFYGGATLTGRICMVRL